LVAFNSGPVNIQYGNSAAFVVEYLTSSGALTVPLSGAISVTYTNTSGSSVVDTVTLSQNNNFFTGIWGTSLASLGLATWVATAGGGSTTWATGQIRVLQRASTY
jgi:hypothetical protein